MVYNEAEKTKEFENEVGNIERCFYMLRLYKEYTKNFEKIAIEKGFTKKQIDLFYSLQG